MREFQYPLLDSANDGTSGGGSAVVDGQEGSSADGSQQSGQSSQQSSGQPAAQSAVTGAQPDKSGEYDRQIKGLTGDLQRERKARQEFERQVAAHKAELEAERQRVRALAGVAPQDPNADKAESVKNAFFQMFPQMRALMELSEEEIQALRQAPGYISQSQQESQRGWQRHGDQQMAYISENVASALGVESLDADQQSDLRVHFSNWLERTAKAEMRESLMSGTNQNPDGDSPTLDAYERGDRSILDKYAQGYTKRWVEPARRQTTANIVNRARSVPNPGGRTLQTQVTKPASFKSLDERIEYAAKVARDAGAFRG